MNRMTLLTLIVLLAATWASAIEIKVKVETDQPAYHIGQTVSWSIYAWSVPAGSSNKGVALIAANLNDSQGEALQPPMKAGLEFADTGYGLDEAFMLVTGGTVTSTAPRLRDMTVMQMGVKQLNVGNDNVPRLLAHGEYVVTKLGDHTLEASLNGANYWNYYENATAFESKTFIPVTFGVFSRGDINFDGAVDVLDLALLAGQWLNVPGSPSADVEPVDGDGLVDLADFTIVASEWLMD